MRKTCMLAALALVLCAGAAAAMEELPRKPIERESNIEAGLCNDHGCGFLHMYNEDWVPLTFNFDELPLIRMGYGDDPRTPGDMLGEGSQGSLRLPPGRYRLRGDNARGDLDFEVQPFHTVSMHFYGVEQGGGYAVRVQLSDGQSNNVMDYRERRQFELPPPPPPPPPPVHYDGWHDGSGWGGGNDGWGDNGGWNDGRPDRWDHPDNDSPWNRPPHRNPPIQIPPPQPHPEHRGPGLQIPQPQPHYVPHIRF